MILSTLQGCLSVSGYCCSLFLFHLGSISTVNLTRTLRALKYPYKLCRTALCVNNTECFCCGPHLDLHQQTSVQGALALLLNSHSFKTLSCTPRAPRHLPAPFLSAWWACCCASTVFSMSATLFLYTLDQESSLVPHLNGQSLPSAPLPPTLQIWAGSSHQQKANCGIREHLNHKIIQVGKGL